MLVTNSKCLLVTQKFMLVTHKLMLVTQTFMLVTNSTWETLALGRGVRSATNLNFQWFEYNSLTESLTGYKLDPEDQRSSVSTKRSRDPDAQQQPQMMATLDRGAYLQMRWELPWTMKQRSYQTKYTSDQPAQNYFSPHAWEWQKKNQYCETVE